MSDETVCERLERARGPLTTVALDDLPDTRRQHAVPRLGRYDITATLGEGGMGKVLAVLDADLNRQVAAKVMRHQAGQVAVAKFVVEAQVTAQLQHPGIVPVYEMGLAEGATGEQLYFTMKAVEGQTLTELVADEAPLARRLQAFLKVCEAMEYAHSRGVVHRDLKPDNIMVGAFGEVLVMDWGLAKVLDAEDPTARAVTPDLGTLDSDDLRTLDGSVMGTPAFMPPEQAEGRIADVGPHSDVYALGAVLYHLLVGEPPFSAPNLMVLLDQVTTGAFEPPSARADVPRELDAVVLRAMALAPADRYASVGELAADVQAFATGGFLVAAQYSAAQRALKWVRQHRGLVGAAAAVLLVACAVAAFFVDRARREAADRLRRAEATATRALAELASVRALRAELKAARALDADVLERDDAQRARKRLVRYLQATRAIDKLLALESTPEWRARRRATGQALGVAAMLSRDYSLAAYAMRSLGDHGVGKEALARLLREVEAERTRVRDARRKAEAAELARRATRLRQMLADLKVVGGEDKGRQVRDYVAEAIVYRDPQTVALLTEALAPLTAKARRDGRDVAWTPEEAQVGQFCCEVLGRLDLPGCLPPLVALMEVVWGSELVVECGIAICRLGRAEAVPIMDAARSRLKTNSDSWVQIVPYLGRLPGAASGATPETAIAYYDRGLARLEAGSYEAAIADFTEAIRRQKMPMAHVNRGYCYAKLFKDFRAIDDYSEAIRLDPELVEAWVNRANAHRRRKSFDQARSDYARALALDPNDLNALLGRGMLRELTRALDGALEDLDRAARVAPKDARVLRQRGSVHRLRGDLVKAAADLDAAVRLDPRNPRSYRRRGHLRFAMKNPQGALRDFTAAIKLERQATNYANRASVRFHIRDYEGAIKDYTVAIRLEPKNAEHRTYRGLCYQRLKQYPQAIADHTAAIAIVRRPAYYLNRGTARRFGGDVDGALEDYLEASRRDPKDWRAVFNRGMLLGATGRLQDARVCLVAARDLAPAGKREMVVQKIAQLDAHVRALGTGK